MAEVKPLQALHYNLAAIGSLSDVVAPPYDVIDADMRSELVSRSPFNAVELDLPQAPEGADPYEHAGETLEGWTLQGILARDRAPALWALEQDYTGPDGVAAHPPRDPLPRPGDRLRPRSHPSPRAHAAGAEGGPPAADPRHAPQPLADLLAPRGRRLAARRSAAAAGPPWAEATDADGIVNRVWRVEDPAAHAAVVAELGDRELLIADGHHRYETARTYADEIGGDGDHQHTLMSLTSLGDPGLTIFGYHRLLTELDEADRRETLVRTAHEHFDVEEVPLGEVDPAGEEGVGVFGYADAAFDTGFRLRLRDAAAMEAALPDRSKAYRELDAAILEAIFLRGALGMSEADVEAKKGLAYTASADAARAALGERAGAAFFMRPTPVEQVRAVAAAGETMPPKSTYFFPKLLTGIVFNPLS